MSDAEMLGPAAPARASLRLTRWLQARQGIRDARRDRPRREPVEPLPPRARRAPCASARTATSRRRTMRRYRRTLLDRPRPPRPDGVERSGQHTGPTDLPLTEDGREAAGAAAAALRATTFAPALSPLARPRDRGAGRLPDRAQVDPDLREYDYGDYEGLHHRRRSASSAPAGTCGATAPRRRDARPGRRARRPRDRPRRSRPKATRCCSPTATSCACSAPAGSALPAARRQLRWHRRGLRARLRARAPRDLALERHRPHPSATMQQHQSTPAPHFGEAARRGGGGRSPAPR